MQRNLRMGDSMGAAVRISGKAKQANRLQSSAWRAWPRSGPDTRYYIDTGGGALADQSPGQNLEWPLASRNSANIAKPKISGAGEVISKNDSTSDPISGCPSW